MHPSIFMVILMVNSIWAYSDDGYQLSETSDSSYVYPEDFQEDEYEVKKRANNNFLRFGRNDNKYDDYEDYSDDFARPTRSGKLEKNDHFIRFGRGKQSYLRFGRDPHRVQRANHLRFGRSVEETESKIRNKRDTYSEDYKRASSNFLRFGRPNSNYMRFGRNNELTRPTATGDFGSLQKDAAEFSEKLKRLPRGKAEAVLLEVLNNLRRNGVAV